MNPQEQEDAKVVKDLQALARHVDAQLPYGWGFVVLAFPFGAGSRMNYISNAQRADIVKLWPRSELALWNPVTPGWLKS